LLTVENYNGIKVENHQAVVNQTNKGTPASTQLNRSQEYRHLSAKTVQVPSKYEQDKLLLH
jgi:hypothetical protein